MAFWNTLLRSNSSSRQIAKKRLQLALSKDRPGAIPSIYAPNDEVDHTGVKIVRQVISRQNHLITDFPVLKLKRPLQ